MTVAGATASATRGARGRTARSVVVALALAAAAGGCSPGLSVVRRGAAREAIAGRPLAVERLRFDRMRIAGEPAAAWAAHSDAAARASLEAGRQLLDARFRARLVAAGATDVSREIPAARGEAGEGGGAAAPGDGVPGDGVPGDGVIIRGSVVRLDPGSFYLGGATKVEIEVELVPTGDVLLLRVAAPATPATASPVTRVRAAGEACAEQLLDWMGAGAR